MKASYVAVISALGGVLLGAAIAWANFGNPPPLALGETDSALPVTDQPRQPKVLVDARIHDFGAVDRDSKATHVFHITNGGDAPLRLKPGGTDCTRCTIAHLSKTELAPGESSEITVEYLPAALKPRFRQTALVMTNDPAERRVELTISGVVTARYQVVPNELYFSTVSTNEAQTAQLRIYSYRTEVMRLLKYEFEDPETAEYFEVRSEPIPPDQLTEPESRGGVIVSVTLKPGLPLGAIRQKIRLDLEMPGGGENAIVEVPIYGRVDSDISIVAPRGWHPDEDRLTIGAVKSAEGATRRVLLVLRGPHRRDVKITPTMVDPPWLKVRLEEPTELKKDGDADTGVMQIPLIIEIPPGTPPANHLGPDQGKLGEIVLETTHPQVKQIRMFLKFVVEQ